MRKALALALLLVLVIYGFAGELEKRLRSAIEEGNLGKVKELVSQGADVNAKYEKALTPLHIAAAIGDSEIVKFLLSHGADVNAKAEGKITPLHLAALGARGKVVKLLISHGADVNAEDEEGRTPLEFALSLLTKNKAERRATIKILEQNGGRIGKLTMEKRKVTETMIRLRNIATAIEEYRLDNGSPPKAKDIYELKRILEGNNGFYIQNMPTEDAWGNPFHYEYDKEHYTICSYGKDGVRGSENGLYPLATKLQDINRDICYKDGMLVIGPSRQ